jgi:hypothetical protein
MPTEMTLSAMRLINISSIDFSSMLCSPNIHTRNQLDRVGKQKNKVRKMGGEFSKAQGDSNQSFVSSDNHSLQKVVLAQHPMG